MQDFSGLGVGQRIDALGLIEGEPLQHAARDARIDPQHLQRGDQSVAAERGRIPGDARIRIAALRGLGHQHVEVGHRLAQHLIEDIVRGFDAGRAGGEFSHFAAMRQQPAKEWRRLLRSRPVAGYRDEQRGDRLRRKFEMPGGGIHRQPRRPRIEMHRRIARLAIEPVIVERDIGRAQQLARTDAAARTLFAAHLEQIGKVVVEQQRQGEARGVLAVVLHADALIGRAAPQKDRAHDVQHVLLQHDPAIAVHIGVGEIDGQRRIVVAQIGAEQQRLHVVQHQFEPGEIAGVGVEQPIGPAGGCADIAMAVEHDERVVMLERTARPRGRPRHRNIERRFRDRLDRLDLQLGYDFSCHGTSAGSPASLENQTVESLRRQYTRIRLRVLQACSFPASPVPDTGPGPASGDPAGRLR